MNNGKIKKVINNPAARKRNVKIVLAAVAGLLVVLAAATLALWAVNEHIAKLNRADFEKSIGEGGSYIFYPIDRQTDILQEEEYLGLDRRIGYKYGEITYYDSQYFSDQAKFVSDALTDAIKGDSATYDARLSDAYKKREAENMMDFTMQRLYNIVIELLDEKQEREGDTLYTYTDLRVSYMIRKNDGTFRNDMESDVARPQVYTVLTTNTGGSISMTISDIILYSKYASGLY